MNSRLKKSHFISVLSVLMLMVGCGTQNPLQGTPSLNPSGTANDPFSTQTDWNGSWNSFSVASMSALPRCDTSKIGALAWVKDEKQFYTCESVGWQVADILPDNEVKITGRWKFHVDSYADSPEISDEALTYFVNIGDVELVQYSNKTAEFSLSGITADETFGTYWAAITDHSHQYVENFSYSGIISNTEIESSKIYKIDVSAQTRLRIKVNFSGTIPTFKATVDVDGNFGDNTDVNIPLTAESIN